jgi:dolichol kinase
VTSRSGFRWKAVHLVALAGSLVATGFELLPAPLDDNFRLPLFAGFCMQLLCWYGA